MLVFLLVWFGCGILTTFLLTRKVFFGEDAIDITIEDMLYIMMFLVFGIASLVLTAWFFLDNRFDIKDKIKSVMKKVIIKGRK